MVTRITSMSYDELQAERNANQLLKDNLKDQLEKVTDTKLSLKLSQELLQLSKRNEKLAERQLVLMSKVKRPIEMSLEEIEAEQEKNRVGIAKFEEDLNSTDFDTRFNASQELRTLYTRTRANASKFHVNRIWYLGEELLSNYKTFN
ncbi:hypothetical protein QUA74_10875 [Microcoleus sp. LAD1_D3]|uniref:hypothetical protein n=1 Tax=Microcoleus sp. LAD1_D3 TaxID=2819365 RepID=UPI002FD1E630